jgi:prepilin-type N-terminal cleavage/methylation domain-containing protein
MGSVRRTRAFTLIEAMIVVVIVGLLAVLATIAYRRWVHSAYLTEAQNMVANIRSAEESFRAENGGYLKVSNALGPGNDYPAATPGKFKTGWGATCGNCIAQWSSLNVQASGPVAFGYSLDASNTASPVISRTVNGAALDISAMTIPWYFVEADADMDGNGVFTKVYGMSATNRIFIDNEGE